MCVFEEVMPSSSQANEYTPTPARASTVICAHCGTSSGHARYTHISLTLATFVLQGLRSVCSLLGVQGIKAAVVILLIEVVIPKAFQCWIF